MWNDLTSLPLFGVILCLGTYLLGHWVSRKVKSPLANPLVIAVALTIAVLQLFHIPLESFKNGGDFIAMFLPPATAALALSIYRQYPVLKANLWPVLLGSAVGSAVSIGRVVALCRLFRLEEQITASLLAKSVTTAIAIEITRQQGGIVPVTVAAVVFTGILGAVFAPALIKLFRVKDPVAAGLAIGTASHALGTTKALELGEVEGAMSSIAIGVAGIMTVVFAMAVSH